VEIFSEPLTKEEEDYYLKRFKDGDQRAKELLIEHNLRLVAYIAKKYVKNECDRSLEDMISVGTIGLIKGVMSFDENKGKLSTYVARCIENEILMMLRGERKKSKEISMYEPIGSDYEGNVISLLDIIERDEISVEVQFETKEAVEILKSVIKNELNEREYEIIKYRYGLENEKEITQREVSKKMGISRSYVSRIEKKALDKLKKAME
jgi:RNA polymerase sporulation-specific sigma factor